MLVQYLGNKMPGHEILFLYNQIKMLRVSHSWEYHTIWPLIIFYYISLMWLLNHYLNENLLIYQGCVEDGVICDIQAGTCFELAANFG